MSNAIEATPAAPSSNWKAAIISGYCVLFGGLGVLLLWATTARLDSAVIAPGLVSVEFNRKTVQHLEGGIVRELLVRDGDIVVKDQVLLRLDPTRTDSMGDLYQHQLGVQLAQEARLLAEREAAEVVRFPAEVLERSAIPMVERAINDQKQQFAVKRETMLRMVELVNAQIAQARQELEQNEIDNKTARSTVENVERELKGVLELYEKKLVSLPRVSALEREQLRLKGVIESTTAGTTKLREKIQELTLKRDQGKHDYQQEAAAQLVEVRKSIAELRQQVILASDAQHRIVVRSPTNGMVQQMRIFTVGGVLRPGDPILDIVPLSENLIVRARVSPLDADRINPEMAAEIRFPSFRYRGFEIIRGKVHAVSRDRLVDEATKDPYFDTQIAIERTSLPPEIAEKLVAGMPAEVVVPTGERTVFAYLVTPLVERFHTSMRER